MMVRAKFRQTVISDRTFVAEPVWFDGWFLFGRILLFERRIRCQSNLSFN